MSAADSGAPSPRSGLSRLRRNKPSNVSSTSLASTTSEDGDVPTTDGGLLAAVDRTIEKVKDRRQRKSIDDRRGSDEKRRLSSIIPRRSRRGSRRDTADDLQLSQQPTIQSSNSYLTSNTSDVSLSQESSSHSSLLTDDAEDSTKRRTRPTISPHDSHAGLLTLSSPLIHAQTETTTSVVAKHSIAPHPSGAQSAPIVPQIVEPKNSSDGTAAEERPATASKKLKEAFTLPRKRSDDSAKSGSVSGLGSIFRPGSRRGSINPVESTVVEEQPPTPREATTDAAEPVKTVEQKERPETPTGTQNNKSRLRINSGSLPATPPNLNDTPTTLVTPPTPTTNSPDKATFNQSPTKGSPATRALSSVDSIRQRRAQSILIPSKLSASVAPPLTPTVEETKTPGGTLSNPATSNTSGFFSNFFSAAQKAANQLSDTIAIGGNQPNQKSKTSLSSGAEAEAAGEEVIPGAATSAEPEIDKKELAVQTLGQGSLSLSHLGISDLKEESTMSPAFDISKQDGLAADEAAAKAEEEAAARAVSAAYEQPVEKVVKQAAGSRPMSVASNDRLGLNGESTPPRPTDPETGGGMRRQGSVRSRLSGRRRRHRGSSATTGNTIAAGIASSTTAISNPATGGVGHRLTGFAVASSKRNKDFHSLFRSVPEDDYLIEDYSAALQRDILLHGRLYVSEAHICFSSNILGWVTNLVIGFDEVVSVEKKSTAVIFPNALVISTLHARNTFASFVARDSTYELLIGIWKINHPNLKSSLNGVVLDDAGTGDKTEKAESVASDDASESGSDEVYDEDEDDDDMTSFMEADAGRSVAGSDVGDFVPNGKLTGAPPPVASQTNGVAPKAVDSADLLTAGATASTDFPGPATHAPTECTDTADHYDRPLTDTMIPAPLGKVYSMMFGSASGAFMKKWLVEDQKSRELDYPDDKIGLDNDHKTVTFSYIKPLNAPVGPRQTKCITQNILEVFDLERQVTVSCSTQTPDVPSGNVFTTKTRYCLMWGPGNSTRMIANCTIEWTGKSWLKGPIEKGAQDGQSQYARDIVAALKAAVTTKPAAKGPMKKGKRKGRRETNDTEEIQKERAASTTTQQKEANWGLLEPLREPLEPLTSLLGPLVSSQLIIGILLVILLYQWLFTSRYSGGTGLAIPGHISPERMIAYEQMWQREESDLWDWLEDRVGLDCIYAPLAGSERQQQERQKVLAGKGMGRKLEDEKMQQRQVDDAIRVTEDRLAALKEAVARKKGQAKA